MTDFDIPPVGLARVGVPDAGRLRLGDERVSGIVMIPGHWVPFRPSVSA